ncbi:uncharacterized protein LOC6536328 [Drosophila yakuba]|uniref:Uncharacterized protein n=1 Tax=Drosophila yakuba TaxID=7245 RepID=B4PUK7_DROYA|nr:uncharacterized protein LOC6536328 [Drosophila yakuba]EDW96624.2 uncharacterized protein Dyak_GE25936 [Drosophila yakuba]
MTCDDATEALVTHMCELVEFYMLPELKEDLDNIQLETSQFESYHSLLIQDLPKLYDLVQEFLQKTGDAGHEKLRVKLLLLICELTASPTIYQLKDDSGNLLRNANELAKKLSSNWWESTDVQILKYYEKKLHRDGWKKQLGAVHGFGRYLELRYGKKSRMPTQMLAFALSVGLNVRECYDPIYKQLGVKIFSVMLKYSDPKDIQELNVHSVIYDHALKDAYNMDSIEAIDSVWNCLYLCLDHFVDLDAFTWNQCDDMLDRLIQNVTMASNPKISICLLQFIIRLGYYFTINRSDVETALAMDISEPDKLAACRDQCLALNVSTSYRWAKAILQMLVLESDKLLQGVEVCTALLEQMLRCYLVCIMPIPLQALHPHLPEFYGKFVAVLMECLVAHEKALPVLKLVLRFTEVFRFQLENGATDSMPAHLPEFKEALSIIHCKISE